MVNIYNIIMCINMCIAEPLPSDIDVWARGAISLLTRTDRRAKSPLVAPAADDQIMSALEFKSRDLEEDKDEVSVLFEPESEDSESELEEQSTASVVETATTIIRQPLLTRRANCKDSVSDELEVRLNVAPLPSHNFVFFIMNTLI